MLQCELQQLHCVAVQATAVAVCCSMSSSRCSVSCNSTSVLQQTTCLELQELLVLSGDGSARLLKLCVQFGTRVFSRREEASTSNQVIIDREHLLHLLRDFLLHTRVFGGLGVAGALGVNEARLTLRKLRLKRCKGTRV